MSKGDHNGSRKKVLVIRYGAIGDHIFLTPVFPLLKRDGYHITMNTTEAGRNLLKLNPYIDEFLIHDSSIPANEELTRHWEKISQGYDRVINFSESIEGSLSKVEWRDDYYKSKEERHAECNVNFYDHTLAWAGYPNNGERGQLHFSQLEHSFMRAYRKKYKKKFLVLWSLSGSSGHKTYPFTEYVARKFLEMNPDAMILTVGDPLCELLEWSHPQTKCYSGKWPIRQSMLATKYVDLVVSTDTGLIHAAGCYDTPKILLLSSTTEENLSKYFTNCTNLSADVLCQPCHRLHYSMKNCLLDAKLKTPECMTKLKPAEVYLAMEEAYTKWKERHGSTNLSHA